MKEATSGFRFWHLEQTLEFKTSLLGGVPESQNWVDAIGGPGIHIPLSQVSNTSQFLAVREPKETATRTLQEMNPMNFPFLVLALSLVFLFLAAYIGDVLRNRVIPLKEEMRDDFGVVLSATLTLLGLLIGFSFSMAVSRYDQRKNYEEAEANAIGTEYVRADLLPARDAARVRELLRKYVDQRVLFYTTRDEDRLAKVATDTAALQNELWSAVLPGATAQPTPPLALVVSGMNDVLNSQGYTQAAWWNRIPIAAWVLMAAIAVCCNLLIGYGAHRTDRRIFLIVPVTVSIAFFLISDIDSPRAGSIRVAPQNLLSLSQSLRSQ
jgi:hypothetical protein